MVLPLVPVLVGGVAVVGVVFAIALSGSKDETIGDQIETSITRVGWISEGIVRGSLVTAPIAIIMMTLIYLLIRFISKVTPGGVA